MTDRRLDGHSTGRWYCLKHRSELTSELMADIVTEQAWLTSVDPIDLSRYGRGRIDPHRFRWLAVAWGQRIRHLLEPENLIWFDAYTAWVSGDSRHPIELDLPEFWMPLDRPIDSVGFSRRFVDILKTLQDPVVMQGALIGRRFTWLVRPPD